MLKVVEFFSSIKAIVFSGVFLVISLVLLLTNTSIIIDPIWITIIICGFPILYSALTKLFIERKIASSLLISIAMIASITINEVFAAGEIAFIMAIGELLEDKTIERAKLGLKKLIDLAPLRGRVIKNNKESIVLVEDIKLNDILRVLPGETIPVDGLIVKGNTSINQAVMTGESLPVDKDIGDSVFSGTINQFGAIEIKAIKIGEDSSLQKLIKMVKDAENNQAPMQRIVDKWASWLVPIALVIALLTYLFTTDIIRGVTILVVFCPCALALATPTSIVAAIGQATKNGVIIKSGEALEKMGKIDYVAFDKTGTLTRGIQKVSDVIIIDKSINKNEFIQIVASIENYSEHPIGKAIANYLKEHNIEFIEIDDFKMIPGKGVRAQHLNNYYLCGNANYLMENNVIFSSDTTSIVSDLYTQGKAIVYVAKNNELIGIIALADLLRDEVSSIIEELKVAKVKPILLTGDNQQSAAFYANQAGIDDIFSQLLPKNKLEIIKDLQNKGHHVCMIGDGVNDAPSLKLADVGIAMGTMGSDIAIEAADIALIGDDLSKLPYLKRLSNATVKLIKINITLSMTINFIAIVLSIYGVLNPITGALVHNIGSVLVVLNAALLYDRQY